MMGRRSWTPRAGDGRRTEQGRCTWRPRARRSYASGLPRLFLVLLMATALAGCGGEELTLPASGDLDDLYGPSAETRLNGNIVEVTVEQSRQQLRRGGSLWAKVGPYIYLFSPQTRELFQDFTGVAAVRVSTVTPSGTKIAVAMLHRDELNAITWREPLQLVSRARTEGTDKPSYLVDLVEYGEERTTYEYNEQYVDD